MIARSGTARSLQQPARQRIAQISLTLIPETAGAPVLARLTRKAAVDKAADGSFSGVWLWAREGQTIASGAMSEADREKGTDNTLDDTIGKFLPDDPNAHVASKVTVRTSRRIGSN